MRCPACERDDTLRQSWSGAGYDIECFMCKATWRPPRAVKSAFSRCRAALTMAETAIPHLRPATVGKRSIPPGELRALCRGARTAMAKCEGAR